MVERTDTHAGESMRDDTSKSFRCAKKDQIVSPTVSSSYVVALCGETFPAKKSAKSDSPACPGCERIHEPLRRK